MHKALGIAITLLTLSSNQAAFPHDPFERSTLAWLNETEPDGVIDGVHLLSGQFCMHEVDYTVPGPTPIRLERFYNAHSGSCDGFRYFDSHILSWYKTKRVVGYTAAPGEGLVPVIGIGWRISSDDPSGSCFTYSPTPEGSDLEKNRATFAFDKADNCLGLTNTGSGVISGQNSTIHRTAQKDAKQIHVRLPDGTHRLFRSWVIFRCDGRANRQARLEHPEPKLRRWDFPEKKLPQKSTRCVYEKGLWNDLRHCGAYHEPTYEKERNYCLDFTRHPNGTITQYDYNDTMDLTKVATRREEHGADITSIHLKHGFWSDKPNRLSRKKIQVSTSDEKTFTYHVRSCNGRTVFDSVEGPGLIPKSIDYQWINGKPLISKISLPEGRFKEFVFFPEGHRFAGKVRAVRIPAGPNGKKIPSLRVEYHNEHVLSAYNGLNGKTDYHFNQEYRLERINPFLGDKIAYKQQFIWGGEANTQLICRLRKGPGNAIHYARHYTYDSDGNVLIENLHGYLSGERGIPRITLNTDTPTGGEVYSLRRTYLVKNGSEQKFNLIKTEEDDFSRKTTFDYKPKTNLLTQKSHYFQDQLTKRETFDYDEDAVCIRKTLQNGETSYTTEISPRQAQPGLAMPQAIRQTITTPQGKRLLSYKKITYGTWHKPIKEEFFDREGSHAYTLTYTYDDMGNLSSATNALGHTTHYRYDANKNLIEEVLPHEDYRVTHTYDLMNRLTSTTQTSGTESFTTTYTYDACGNRISSTDPQGYTTRYEYDQLSRLTKKISPPITDADGKTLTPIETYTYNALDQITSITHPDGTTTTKTYTTRGAPTFIKHPDGTKEYFTYRLDGKLATHTNTLGVTTTYTYDAYDNICHTKATDPSGALLYETADTYNAFHHLSHTDACGITTTYTYNAYGELEREETENTNGYITYGYDTLGRQTSVHHYVEGALQYAEYKTYDLANRVTATWIETPTGTIQSKTTTTYDALGRPTSTTTYGENGPETTQTSYDILGRPTKMTDPLGDTTSITYHFQVGPKTKLFRITTTDSLGRTTNEFHDGCGNLRQITKYDTSGNLILSEKRHYDVMGNLTHHIQDSLSDEPPFILHQTYGPNSQPLSTTEAPKTPYAKKTTYSYNKRGLLKTKTKPDGITLTYTYDALGRIASLVTPNISYHYTYDNAHRLTQVKDARGKTLLERSYNTLGNLTKDSYGVTLHHTYDACERQLSTTLPDHTTITYAYDGPNLYSSTYKNLTTSITSRDPSGRITAITLANSDTITKAYDPCGRLIALNAPHFSQKNTYDALGRLTHQSTTDPVGAEQTLFTYDDLDQLLSEENSTPQTYTYDGLHNRTSHNDQTTAYNPLNQIASSTYIRPTYNKCGHLVEKETPTEKLSFTYDDLDRLIKITGDDFSYDFTYDPLDRRVTEWYRSKEKIHHYTFLYDGQCEIGALEVDEVLQLRVPLESIDAEIGGSHLFFLGSEPYYPTYDHRGNLTVLCQEKPLYTYRYTGFGERTTWEIKHNEHTLWSIKQDLANYIYGAIQEATTDISPWHFASKRSLSRANLTSFGRRDYDASLGRWLIPDPQGFDDGINLYAYVHNSPITGYDAWGLDCRGFDYSSWDVIRDRGLNRLSEHALCASVATRTVFNDFANIGIAATNRFNNKWGTGPQFNYINTDFSSWRQSFNTTFNTNRFNTVADTYISSAQNVGHFATESIITGAAMGAAFRTASAMNSVGKSLSLAYTGAAERGLVAAGGEAFSTVANASARGTKAANDVLSAASCTGKMAQSTGDALCTIAGDASRYAHFFKKSHMQFYIDKSMLVREFPSSHTRLRFLTLMQNVGSNPANLKSSSRFLSPDAIKAGTQRFAETFRNGREIWVDMYNGVPSNGGINVIPRH